MKCTPDLLRVHFVLFCLFCILFALYSTVTDFARFFGLSMSQPFSFAT